MTLPHDEEHDHEDDDVPDDPDPDAMDVDRRYALTDMGNAERLVRRHGRDIHYIYAWAKWLGWTGRYWRIDDTGAVERAAKATVRHMYREAARIPDPGKRQDLFVHAGKSESATRLAAMIRLAQSEPGIAITHDQLDRDHWVLPLRNGTLDLCTGELRASRREDMCTRHVPINWDPSAQCPMWTRFVTEIMGGNANLIAFIQRAVGYSLTGSVREQVLFFLVGDGSNGKSTFILTLLEMLGDYAIQAAPDLLLAKKGEVHPTEQSDLFGRRVAACVEVEKGRAFAEVTLKQLTGSDRIRSRRMREDFWEFFPTHKLWISANHKPIVRGTDLAIWRRLLLIPFDVTFTDDRKDTELPAKLRGELPGILAWAMEGCRAWQCDGLKPPDAVLHETAKYRAEMDVLGQFVSEKCVVDPRAKVGATELYRAYVTWSEAAGDAPQKQRGFGHAMTERGFPRQKDGHANTVTYQGIRLRVLNDADEADDADEDPVSTACKSPRVELTGGSSASSAYRELALDFRGGKS